MKAAEGVCPSCMYRCCLLVCSLQFKTEHGKFLLESLRERPTKPLQERNTKDVFKEKINRKGNVGADSW